MFSFGDGDELLEDDPDDPMRTAIRQMRGSAQLERGLIRQRMANGRREKKAQGGMSMAVRASDSWPRTRCSLSTSKR